MLCFNSGGIVRPHVNYTRIAKFFGSFWTWSIFMLAVVLTLVTAYQFDKLSFANYDQKIRADTSLQLLGLREKIESVVHEQSIVLREISTVIREKPEITQAEFTARIQTIRELDESLISIVGAPDMVASLVYPLEGNESVVGLNYAANTEQYPMIQEMLERGMESITGPVDLVQGGKGLIFRTPIYPPSPKPSDPVLRPWGIVSIALDYPSFVEKTGILEAAQTYDLLIDISDRAESHTGSFIGDRAVENMNPITLDFEFPFQTWHLHALPKGGWPTSSPTQGYDRAVMAVMSLSFLTFLGSFLWLTEQHKRAKAQLSNAIEALDDGFVMFDADDCLILSNERYREIYGFPKALLRYGTPYADIVNSSLLGSEAARVKLIEHRRRAREIGAPTDLEQPLLDGRVIKVSDRPMKDGSYVGLRVDISELNRVKVAAESASKAKTDFINVLSHELRTPLTVLLGVGRLASNARLLNSSKTLLAALETGDPRPDEIRRLLDEVFAQLSGLMDRMMQSGDHLLHLINEMLDFSKIETGGLSVSPRICTIKEIVDPVVNQLSSLSQKKGLKFEVRQDQGQLYADPFRTQQILFNLIGNAIKFTEKGSVRLLVSAGPDEVVFEVQDSGLGIPEAEFDRIFAPFYQIDSTSSRSAGGTGMGLTISRNLALLQNGSLTVSSKLRKGSAFVLKLPVAKPLS